MRIHVHARARVYAHMHVCIYEIYNVIAIVIILHPPR